MNNFPEIENPSVQSNSLLNSAHLSPFINPRILYLRRLYFMLTLQLLLCVIVSLCTLYFPDLKNFLSNHNYIVAICAVMIVLLMLFGYLMPDKVSFPPLNWVYFFIFTTFLAFFFAYIIAIANSKYAVMVLITLDLLYLALFIYALTTKTVLTYYGASLYVLGASFFSLEIFLIFTDAQFMFLLVMTLGLGIFAFYVIYITQTLMQGIKTDYGGQDWISGSCTIYLEVFLMFTMFADRLGDIILKERN